MSWPDIDIHAYRLTTDASWAYVQDVPESELSINSTLGWSWEVLRIEPDIKVVPHLLTEDVSVTLTRSHWLVSAQGSARAVWEGPIGISNPAVQLGWHNRHWLVTGLVLAPLGSNRDAQLNHPYWLKDITISYGAERFRASTGVTHTNAPAVHIAAGYAVRDVKIEGYAQSYPPRAELSASLELSNKCWTALPSFITGLLSGPGNPRLRLQLAVQYGCRKELPPAAPAVQLPDPPAIASPPELNAEEGKPGVFPSPKESISGFLSANSEVIVFIRTNIPKEEADALLAELAANKGLPMQQVDHIEYVDAKPGEPDYLDFVVIRGNKQNK
jgi:hypothetical protein